MILILLGLVLSFQTIPLVKCERVVLQCHNEEDYFQFLYKVCLASPPCKVLFHLYPPGNETPPNYLRYQREQDFELFRMQLRQQALFSVKNTTSRTLLSQWMPDTWLPEIDVILQQDEQIPWCSDETVLHRANLSGVRLVALYVMHLYKMSVSDEYFCHNHNERLILDMDGIPYCLCKQGKVCNNEANFNHLYTFLQTILIVLISVLILTTLASLFYKRYLLIQYKLVTI